MNQFRVATVERSSLVDILRGVGTSVDEWVEIREGRLHTKLAADSVGIGYFSDAPNAHPDFVIVPDAKRREFFAWINTYCSFATPLSQWCRVVTQDELVQLQTPHIAPRYGDVVAAWAGAIVGEALLHVGAANRLSQLSVTALQSCASFVAARAFGLWGNTKLRALAIDQYEAARLLLGAQGANFGPNSFSHVWKVLETLSVGFLSSGQRLPESTQLTIEACRDIQATGFVGSPTISQILSYLEWSKTFSEFERFGAEERLKVFDEAVTHLTNHRRTINKSQLELAEFIVAYFAARLGGSVSAHVELIEGWLGVHPTLALWFGIISALYRPGVWGIEFGGLARIAGKELGFPLRLDDPPRCDVSFDDLTTLVEPNEHARIVGFRGAMRRALNVEVALGVNGFIRVPDTIEEERITTIDKKIIRELVELRRSLRASSEIVNRLESAFGLPNASRNLLGQSKRQTSQSSRGKGKTRGRKGGRQSDYGP